jgi:hypothetical protein
MEKKEKKHEPGSVAHPVSKAGVDKKEAGPSRLYAPGKPHEVESGPSRLRTSVLGRAQAAGMRTIASTRPQVGAAIDATEAGPARIARYPR